MNLLSPKCVIFLLICFTVVNTFEPLSTGLAIAFGTVAITTGVAYIKCKFMECCNTENGWLRQDFAGLEQDLDKNLYGQHLVKETVLRLLKQHYTEENPNKPLVMSFHGSTGTGKNHVSSLIVNRMYKNGFESKYVHLWIGKYHFRHEVNVERHSKELRTTLANIVSDCPRALFVIDEMDYVDPGVIDTLKPYLDHHEKVGGIDYRKATFIFLSNTGATNISALAFTFKYNRLKREDITMKDIRPLIENGAFNEKGGLKRASIIRNNLIDVFVPFLPLEREHLNYCIEYYLNQKRCKYTTVDIDLIADQFTFSPPGYEYFSKTGCKLLSSIVTQTYNDPCIHNKINQEL